VNLYWEISALPVLFKFIFVETKLKYHLAAGFISDFNENTTSDFVLFYQKL